MPSASVLAPIQPGECVAEEAKDDRHDKKPKDDGDRGEAHGDN